MDTLPQKRRTYVLLLRAWGGCPGEARSSTHEGVHPRQHIIRTLRTYVLGGTPTQREQLSTYVGTYVLPLRVGTPGHMISGSVFLFHASQAQACLRNMHEKRNAHPKHIRAQRTFVFLELCMTKFHRAQNERTNVAAMWQPHT